MDHQRINPVLDQAVEAYTELNDELKEHFNHVVMTPSDSPAAGGIASIQHDIRDKVWPSATDGMV